MKKTIIMFVVRHGLQKLLFGILSFVAFETIFQASLDIVFPFELMIVVALLIGHDWLLWNYRVTRIETVKNIIYILDACYLLAIPVSYYFICKDGEVDPEPMRGLYVSYAVITVNTVIITACFLMKTRRHTQLTSAHLTLR